MKAARVRAGQRRVSGLKTVLRVQVRCRNPAGYRACRYQLQALTIEVAGPSGAVFCADPELRARFPLLLTIS